MIGAWIGYQLSGYWWEADADAATLQSLGKFGRLFPFLAAYWLPIAATLAGALAGWVFGRPLNTLLGASFRFFNIGFDYSAGLYRGRSAACCASACWYCSFMAGCSF